MKTLIKHTKKAACMVALTLGLLAVGCHTVRQTRPVARATTIQQGEQYKYEIELRQNVKTFELGHTGLPIPQRYQETNWLYVNRLEGQVPAAEAALTHYRRHMGSPWIVSHLRGELMFTNQSVSVNLQGPRYKYRSEVPDRYEPLEINGVYKLNFPSR